MTLPIMFPLVGDAVSGVEPDNRGALGAITRPHPRNHTLRLVAGECAGTTSASSLAGKSDTARGGEQA